MNKLLYMSIIGIAAIQASCSGNKSEGVADYSNDTILSGKIRFVNETEGVAKFDPAYLVSLTPEQKVKLDPLIKMSAGVLDIEANSATELIEKIEAADIDSCRAFIELIKEMTKEEPEK